MIERHDGRQQIVCDTCPASYPNTYADADFAVMIADAKTAGWSIRPAPVDPEGAGTADMFASLPVAGKPKAQRYIHTCPDCRDTERRGDFL